MQMKCWVWSCEQLIPIQFTQSLKQHSKPVENHGIWGSLQGFQLDGASRLPRAAAWLKVFLHRTQHIMKPTELCILLLQYNPTSASTQTQQQLTRYHPITYLGLLEGCQGKDTINKKTEKKTDTETGHILHCFKCLSRHHALELEIFS